MKDLLLILYSITAGFTASGIIVSLYKIAGLDPDTAGGKALRIAVVVVAGPVMLFESAVRGFLAKKWPAVFFWLATAAVTYWSLAIGLFIIDVAIHV